jgi:general secretion pathway protein I
MARLARPAAGFTLIETIIALAILGLTLVVLGRVLQGGLAGGRRDMAIQRALLFARSTMDRVGLDLPLRSGSSSGPVPGGGSWRLTMRPWADPAAPPSAGLPLLQVELTVSVPPVAPLTLTTLRLAPVRAPSP